MKKEEKQAFNDGFDDAGKLLLFHSRFFVKTLETQMGIGPKIKRWKKTCPYEYWYGRGFRYRIDQVERDGVLSNEGRKSLV